MHLFELPVARYRLTFQAVDTVCFPAYAGSAWRGAFGHALRRTVCITRQPQCAGCLLQRSCVYSQVFETPAGHQPLLEKVNTAPHPYILHPLATSGKHYAPGECFELYLTLLGKAIDHLPYLIHALRQVGEQGLGKGQGRCQLQLVEQQAMDSGKWQEIHRPGGSLHTLPLRQPGIPAPPEYLQIRLTTPLRLVQNGKLVHADRFSFQAFFNPLMRRISLLHAHHAAQQLTPDFKTLSQQAACVPLPKAELHWYEWSRYSSRQQSRIQMGGLLGTFDLPMGSLTTFWPWLWLGQWVHVGKGAVMGMGEYVLDY